MSLVVDLAVLAEGAATDARGSLTLVAANPHILVADELPVQFSPVFLVTVQDDAEDDAAILAPGRPINAKIEVIGPDDEALFVSQLRQAVAPPPFEAIRPALNLLAQVLFTASKIGKYRVSAHIEVIGEGNEAVGEVTATRIVTVTDRASLNQRRRH
jgi:hypothetical protein